MRVVGTNLGDVYGHENCDLKEFILNFGFWKGKSPNSSSNGQFCNNFLR